MHVLNKHQIDGGLRISRTSEKISLGFLNYERTTRSNWAVETACLRMRRVIVTFQLGLNTRHARTLFEEPQYIASALNDTGLERRGGVFGVSTDDYTKDNCSSASSFLGVDPEASSASHATAYPRSECILKLRCQAKRSFH